MSVKGDAAYSKSSPVSAKFDDSIFDFPGDKPDPASNKKKRISRSLPNSDEELSAKASESERNNSRRKSGRRNLTTKKITTEISRDSSSDNEKLKPAHRLNPLLPKPVEITAPNAKKKSLAKSENDMVSKLSDTAVENSSKRRSSRRSLAAKKSVIEDNGDSASEDEDFSAEEVETFSEEASDEESDEMEEPDGSDHEKTIFITSKKVKPLSRKLISKKRYLWVYRSIPNFKIAKRRDDKRVVGDVFEQAAERLHVSAVPDSLPCREEEYCELYGHLSSAIEDAAGTCICKFFMTLDISGVPGTGKTATVKSVLRALAEEVEKEQLPPFEFVEINGMRLSEPQQAYTELWRGINGQTVSPAHAEELLSGRFSGPSKSSRPVVVLMDELDVLVTKKQSVVYNFFNWPNLEYSKLIVVAVANTMDLPERMLSTKVSSRLGFHRLICRTYQDYVSII